MVAGLYLNQYSYSNDSHHCFTVTSIYSSPDQVNSNMWDHFQFTACISLIWLLCDKVFQNVLVFIMYKNAIMQLYFYLCYPAILRIASCVFFTDSKWAKSQIAKTLRSITARHQSNSFMWDCRVSDIYLCVFAICNSGTGGDQSCKSHNLPVPYPTIHFIGTEMYTWCIVGYEAGEFWDLWVCCIVV